MPAMLLTGKDIVQLVQKITHDDKMLDEESQHSLPRPVVSKLMGT
jgi:hypothetical protein